MNEYLPIAETTCPVEESKRITGRKIPSLTLVPN